MSTYITKAEFEAFKATLAKQLCECCNSSSCGSNNCEEVLVSSVIMSGNTLLVTMNNGVINSYTLNQGSNNPIINVTQNTNNVVFTYADNTTSTLNIPNKFVKSIDCLPTGIRTNYTDGTSSICTLGGGASFNGIISNINDITDPSLVLTDKLRRPNDEAFDILTVSGSQKITVGYSNYFTTEHLTGQKWINGKDIYRKVLTCSDTKIEYVAPNYYGSIGNYDLVIDTKVLGHYDTNGVATGRLATTPYIGKTHFNNINGVSVLIYETPGTFTNALASSNDCNNLNLPAFTPSKGDVFLNIDSTLISSNKLDRMQGDVFVVIEYTKS